MTAVITEEYRALNRKLHESRADYGAGYSTSKWYPHIANFAKGVGARSILDYGCGKGGLGRALSHVIVQGYDPAIPGKDATPEPADMVVCTDVLEHIEPELLDNVLDDLKRCTLKACFLTVATRPAQKILEDGRNAHLIQEKAEWWLPKLMARWELRMFQADTGEFAIFALAKQQTAEARVAA